jgi:hypothetical protein
MAGPTDSVDLALADLENEPLPTHTRDHSTRPGGDDEIVVDYADETGQDAPPASQKSDIPPETREVPVEEGIEALRSRLQASDTARRQAEERANQAEQARVQATTGKQEADLLALNSALEGVRQSMGVLEANLAEAYAVQDFAQAAKIQTQIARLAQQESQIEGGVEYLKNQPKEQPRAAPAADDPVEVVARQLTPNAAAWIRSHPDYITDPQKNYRLMGAHNLAMAEGLAPDSPAYIRFVEDRVLERQPEPQPERRQTVADTRQSAPPAAPVSRGNGAASNPTRVTLTPEQRETAHENFPDEMAEDPTGRKAEQAYARNMLILRREKRMN